MLIRLLLIYGLGFGLDSNACCKRKSTPAIDLVFQDSHVERLFLTSPDMNRRDIANEIFKRIGPDFDIKRHWIYLMQRNRYGIPTTRIFLEVSEPFYKQDLFKKYEVFITDRKF